MRYLEGHGNVSGRSEQANPLPVTISIASRRLAHLSVVAEKNSVKPRPSISKRCRIGARLLNRCARHMTGGRWLTLVDLVANSIPFCEVRVLSPFAFCACKRAWAADHPAIAQGLRIYRSRGVCRRSAAVGASSRPTDCASLGLPAVDTHVPGALAPPSEGIMSLFRRTS
jgi:hypothetical protein